MAPECEICNAGMSKNNPVVALSEVMHGEPGGGSRLNLCQTCIQRREVRAWPADGRMGRAILRGLAGHPETYGDRYTYFEDAESVHLLRLRAGWAQRHAQEPRPQEAWVTREAGIA